ncbi:MAG: hypothetical protein V1720_08725 [bacterium]
MEELKKIVSLVDNLTEDRLPIWGRMTHQHMIEHLISVLRISCGELSIGCMIPQERWDLMKRVLMSDKPLPKDFVNPLIGADLLDLEYDDLNSAIIILKEYFEKFLKYFENNPDAVLLNPTFGELNFQQWIQFHKKHFTHHFKQFGLIE